MQKISKLHKEIFSRIDGMLAGLAVWHEPLNSFSNKLGFLLFSSSLRNFFSVSLAVDASSGKFPDKLVSIDKVLTPRLIFQVFVCSWLIASKREMNCCVFVAALVAVTFVKVSVTSGQTVCGVNSTKTIVIVFNCSPQRLPTKLEF